MRKLVILRGAPGSGKTTFVKEQGLEPYALSPDSIRISLGGIVMDPFGRITIDQSQEPKVWRQLEDTLDHKMQRGQFVILDATFQRSKDFKMPLTLAQQHRYECLCIDFSDISMDVAIQRNAGRPAYKRVPDDIIARAYERFETGIAHDIRLVPSSAYAGRSLLDDLGVKPVNLNHYKKIHHIGDLQGCYAPVAEYFQNGFRDDEFYIFVGDFLDRGIQNGEVIRWVVDEVMNRPNVLMIWGNHEYHIHRFATGQLPVSKDFERDTLPQIEKAGFTTDEANQLCNKLLDCYIYEYGATRCFVSHAGVSAVPEHPVLLSSAQYWKGTGMYEHPVDQIFSDNMAGTNWIQIHGHRNAKGLPVQAAEKSFNLEAEVEFGGCLRVMTLTQDGAKEFFEIKNEIFKKGAAKSGEQDEKREGESQTGKISQEALDNLLRHDLVNCKNFKSYPHVRSYNFTRKAFTKGHWDEVNITARGLFVDDKRNIVARSYSKFFNLDEREETQMGNLPGKLTFPLTLYVKENGFLGILGFDELSQDLFFASKSTPEGPFAEWFKEIFVNQVGAHRLDYLRRTLRDRNLGMVFEVNDPVRDPHMIEYAGPHVVLLDIVYRTQDFKRLGYEEAQKLASGYGIPFKQKAMTFKNWESFRGWYSAVENQGMNYTFQGKHVEGFVVEDAKDFMFKIKLPYYSFWKYMRSLKERILFIREKGGELDRDLSMPEAPSFYEWANKQPDDVLQKDIITLRTMFQQDFAGN